MPRHEKHPLFRWVSILGIFNCIIGDVFEISTQAYPPEGVTAIFFPKAINQKFRKGVGGQRGLTRGNHSYARDSGLFSVPFFLCPLGEGGHNSGDLFWLFLGVRLSPTPSRQPLFETSELNSPSSEILHFTGKQAISRERGK